VTVRDLIERLQTLPPDLDVEVMDEDGNDSRLLGTVHVERVTRGWALPVPEVYDVVRLGSGWEGV
jgi:hypothetical protein